MTFDLNTALLSFIILLLGWIKLDQKDLWNRMNNHRHEAECKKDDGVCKIHVNGVLIGDK